MRTGIPTIDRVHEFFANNPDEELTFDQLCIKFDLKKTQAHDVVKRLKARGFIESVQVVRLAKMY